MALLLDITSFEALFQVNYKPLCETAYRIVLDRDIAEDIVQDIFCKLYEQKKSLKIAVSIREYLFKGTISKSLLYIKRVKNVNLIEHYVETINNSEMLFPGTGILSHDQDNLNYALRTLPDASRTVFILSRYENLSFKEISAELKISPRMAEAQLSKALAHLYDYLS